MGIACHGLILGLFRSGFYVLVGVCDVKSTNDRIDDDGRGFDCGRGRWVPVGSAS